MKFSFWNKKPAPQTIESAIADEAFFADLRHREFARLDKTGHCYLDFTGGNLYPQSLLQQHCEYLSSGVYGNPHSGNPTSLLSTQYVHQARQDVLDYFNAEDYFCIFTANASASLQIIGECYPFDEHSRFVLTADNHNSVNGIREYCKNKKGSVTYCLLNYEDLHLNKEFLETELNKEQAGGQKLFAFPAQSNVSGVKHDLGWIAYAKSRGWDVLLDAAAFVPSSRLDLKTVQPDFVSVSFYKIFGYPTGLGCLLVRKDKFEKLRKPWFAGGTVTAVSVQYEGHFLASDHERFENGTVDYLGIPAVTFGLNFIKSIGIDRINKRVKALGEYLKAEIVKLQHSNGEAVIKLFGPNSLDEKGGTFILNFRDINGEVIPFATVENMANAQMISIRTGCFCNPGIDEINNCITNDELGKYFTSRKLGNYYDMISFLGKMRGAIRISFGMPTTQADLDRFIEFAKGLRDKKLSDF